MSCVVLSLCLLATAFGYATAATAVTGVSLTIAADKRIAAQTTVPITLAFTTSGALAIGGKITLNYPSGFFATSAAPAANAATTASVATMTATSAAPTATSIVITTAVAGIPTMTAFTITLSGLTMGVAALASATGITVQTESDTAASAGATSGSIGAPLSVLMTIAADKRVAGATAAVTLAFTTSAPITAGDLITLTYPTGFFGTSSSIAGNAANTITGSTGGTMTATSAQSGSTIVITTVTAGVLAATAFTIVLSNVIMGVATAGSATGITVKTSTTGTITSAGAPSGSIGAPLSVLMTIAADKRVAGATAVPVTLAFTTTAPITAGDLITLTYPSGFFAASTIAGNAANTITGSTGGTMTATSVLTTSASTIVITTVTAGVVAGTAFTIVLSGLVMGVATLGSATGITVQTSTTGTIASAGFDSGSIGAPYAVAMTIASTDRMHSKAAVPVTLAFKVPVALATSGKITLTYPSGFFATSATPAANAATTASVATMTATSAAPGATSIVITTAVIGIAADTLFTITLSGLTMGVGNSGSTTGIMVQTDTVGTIASAGFDSGAINTAVTNVGFVIAAAKRAPASAAAILTLSFTPTSEIQIGGKITVNYPSGFFATSATPTANAATTASVATMTATSAAPGATSIVITTAVAGAAAGAVFTITVSGFTMGVASAGGDVTVQTDTDIAASPKVSSGGLGTPVTLFTAKPSATTLSTASTTLVLAFTATTTVAIGGTISFWFPTGWYDTTAAPTNNAASSSSVATLTATSVFSGDKIVITTAVAAIPVGAFTITLSGLKTGATAVAAGKYTLATSGDTVGLEIDSPALGAVGAASSTKSASSILTVTVTVSVFAFVSLMLMF